MLLEALGESLVTSRVDQRQTPSVPRAVFVAALGLPATAGKDN